MLGVTPLLALQDVEFRFQDEKGKLVAWFANLSSTKCRIVRTDAKAWPSIGQEIAGEIVFNWASHTMRAKVERITESSIECFLSGDRSPLSNSLGRYFGTDHDARELFETPTEVLEKDPVGNIHVLRGAGDFELTLVLNSNLKILKFSLLHQGHHVDGGRGLPTHWGRPEREDIPDKPMHKGSTLVDAESVPAAIVDAAAAAVGKIRQLTLQQVTELQSLIRAKP